MKAVFSPQSMVQQVFLIVFVELLSIGHPTNPELAFCIRSALRPHDWHCFGTAYLMSNCPCGREGICRTSDMQKVKAPWAPPLWNLPSLPGCMSPAQHGVRDFGECSLRNTCKARFLEIQSRQACLQE